MKVWLIVLGVGLAACTSASSNETTAPAPPPSASSTTEQSVGGDDGSELVCWSNPVEANPGPIRLEEATEQFGLVEPLVGMHAHAAAVGDLNGDGLSDLLVGTFADRPPEDYAVRGADGPSPDLILISVPGFEIEQSWSPELGRTSGALFADLDSDGDDDVVLVRNERESESVQARSTVYENREGDLVEAAEPLPVGLRGRTPTVADFDSDGLLDLYVAEDRHGETGGILLRNSGGFSFEDVTDDSGLEGMFSLGARAADLNGDRRADLVLSRGVFLNTGDFTFTDVTPSGYVTEPFGAEDDPAGVAVGDLNRDGRPDIVVGQHFRSIVEFDTVAPIRVFLNQSDDESARFLDITESSGIPHLSTLAPHVHIADLNNDSYPDILTSGSAADGGLPAVFLNLGGDTPTFEPAYGDGTLQYWIGAPVFDVDRDGRLDMFAVEWEPSLPSLLFRNISDSGHWLEVSIDGPGRGVGYTVVVSDSDGGVIGAQEIGVATGYSSAHEPVAHFGLGDLDQVLVEIVDPEGEMISLGVVAADAHLRWPEGCGA